MDEDIKVEILRGIHENLVLVNTRLARVEQENLVLLDSRLTRLEQEDMACVLLDSRLTRIEDMVREMTSAMAHIAGRLDSIEDRLGRLEKERMP
jgi:hypothetical protein